MSTETRLVEIHKQRMVHRARIAALSRSRAESDPALVEARQELAVLKIEDALLRYRADPDTKPLTADQIERLVNIVISDDR